MDTLKKSREDVAFSSSPAFGTPVHPFPPSRQRVPAPPVFRPAISTILPIILPPPSLRPLAFRTFTKKHNLTLNASALQALATFVGRHCGSAWREDGTGEKVLEEVAKLWKAENGPVIIEDGAKLQGILKTLEGCMSGGRILPAKNAKALSRQNSLASDSAVDLGDLGRQSPLNGNAGISRGARDKEIADVDDDDDDDDEVRRDPRAWLKVISAFEQPRFSYNMDKKHFVQMTTKPTLFPNPSHKTAIFRERFNIIHQRLLRNEAFQAPTFQANTPTLSRSDSMTAQQFYKITPIANLLGRGGSSHLLLGMLVIAPTGTIAINDLTGSISLDLQHAQPLQGENSSFFCPGMIVLVDGVYEEDWVGAGSSDLGNAGGIGGSIGGRFVGFTIGGPPVERRSTSLSVETRAGETGGGFGWTDFLGLGSDRAVGTRMRRLEERLVGVESTFTSESRRKMVILSELNLDQPSTLTALRKVLEIYDASDEPPLAFTLIGNFSSQPAMAGASVGSIEYKEIFNELAAVMSEFPNLLRTSTWTFIPGDNDAWDSAFSAGGASTVPRQPVPELFTNRIKRAFATAKSEAGFTNSSAIDGEAIWTSNPARISAFGPVHDIVIHRDDISGRFRRNAIRIGQAIKPTENETSNLSDDNIDMDTDMSGALPSTEEVLFDPETNSIISRQIRGAEEDDFATATAKKIILSLLPQSTLAPFPLTTRPIHWDYHQTLALYPLPHTLVLADAEAPPFAMTFEGCHVLNPGRLVVGGQRRKTVQWAEYDLWTKRGTLRNTWIG